MKRPVIEGKGTPENPISLQDVMEEIKMDNNVINESIKLWIKRIVRDIILFELNDKKSREKFKRAIKSLFNKRDNFKAKKLYIFCDDNINTPEIIDNNSFESLIFVQLKKEKDFRLYHLVVTTESVKF